MAHKHDCVTLVISFITWITDRIKLVHQYNHIKPAPEPIEGSYYPPGGTAYYFMESGQQLRKLPKYDCDSGFNKCTIMMKQILWTGSVKKISHQSAWEDMATCFYGSVANMGIVMGST